jgi:hypothetical protein
MPMGILFWVLMVLWLIFGLWRGSDDLKSGRYGPTGGNLLLFVLLGLLGWRAFGPPLQ